MVMTLGAATLAACAWIWRSGLSYPRSAVAGVCLGLAVLTKTTTIGLALVVGMVLAGACLAAAPRRWGAVARAAVAPMAAVAVLLPWVAFNLSTYGALSAGRAVNEITGGAQARGKPGVAGLWTHFTTGWQSFWEWPVGSRPTAPLGSLLNLAVVAALAGACFVLLTRRRRASSDYESGTLSSPHREPGRAEKAEAGIVERAVMSGAEPRSDLMRVIWLAATLPCIFAGLMGIVYLVFNNAGTIVGRYLYAALPALAVLIAVSAAIALGPKWATLAIVWLVALALVREQGVITGAMDGWYATDLLFRGLAPLAEQPVNDGFVAPRAIALAPPCKAEAVTIWVEQQPPSAIAMSSGASASLDFSRGHEAVYRLPGPTAQAFELRLPRNLRVGASVREPSPHAEFIDGEGHPMIRIYCPVVNPRATRFSQTFPPNHVGSVSYGFVRSWAAGWAITGVAGAAAITALHLRRRREFAA
ncbi:MAG TPA: hypothetical protein VNE62_00945 [Actinomycetota bacterium]|nr:hypothetical protein [Actinomycetota bacterium]